MMRLVLLFGLLLTSANAADSLRDFECKWSLAGKSGHCRVQDIAEQGYSNRWHVILHGFSSKPDAFADFVRERVTDAGTLEVSISLWGNLKIRPRSLDIADAFKSHAGLYEVRPQRIEIHALSENTTELLIYELPADYDPLVGISDAWQADHARDFMRLWTNHGPGYTGINTKP